MSGNQPSVEGRAKGLEVKYVAANGAKEAGLGVLCPSRQEGPSEHCWPDEIQQERRSVNARARTLTMQSAKKKDALDEPDDCSRMFGLFCVWCRSKGLGGVQNKT